MVPSITSNVYPGLCGFPEPYLLLFSDNVPPLVYYSHLPILIIALILGIFVLFKNPHALPNRTLFLLTLSFSFYVFIDSIFWASNRGDIITFIWSLQILVEPLIYISALYLMYTLTRGYDLPFFSKLFIGILYFPVIVLLPTDLMLYAFDETICLSLEGPFATYYTYGIEVIFLLLIIIFTIFELLKNPKRRAEILITGTGISCFLLMFSIGNVLSSFAENWKYAQIGLFTMPIFISFFVYSIVKYGTFRIRLVSTMALVFALSGLNFSFLFIAQSDITKIVAGFTFFLSVVFGILIIRGVKREIIQKEQIAQLAQNLQVVNQKLKILDKMKSEFVSIASHQLRSPLTSIRGYASMLAEGSYGKLAPKAQEIVNRIGESAKYMALSVEDYLNVSRIEAGNMKYELSNFSMKEVTEKIVSELRPVAVQKGLMLIFKSNCISGCLVHADIGKMRQILMNLIDNSMKYTPKGTITVSVSDNKKSKRVTVCISDTGVGMSLDTQHEVFEKFVRAKNANNVNVTGTGLGLYVAKKMVDDMGGTVIAKSEGEERGSQFILEFSLVR